MDEIDESVTAIFAMYTNYGSSDYIGEPVSQTEHMVQCAMLAEAEGHPNEIILGALFHDIGHLIGMDRDLPRMETDAMALGIENHDKIGSDYLRKHGFPEIVCQMVGGHVDAKRYLVFKDKSYHDALSDASKMTLIHQGGPMTAQEAQVFETSPAFHGILRMRIWDERAKDPNMKIDAMDKYRLMCREYLKETRHL